MIWVYTVAIHDDDDDDDDDEDQDNVEIFLPQHHSLCQAYVHGFGQLFFSFE